MEYKHFPTQQVPLPGKGGARGGLVLGIDLRCLPADGSEGAGIAHAARAITRALCESVPVEWSIQIYLPRGSIFHSRLPTPPATQAEQLSAHQFHELTCEALRAGTDSRLVHLSGSRRSDLVSALKTSPCDLLFVPSGGVSLNLPVPAIPWVHDIDIYAHPEWFGESWLTRLRTTWMFWRGLKRAPVIFSVSEYTKREIGKRDTAFGKRIFVTGEGGDESLLHHSDEDRASARERLNKLGIPDKFILMLGTIEPRKNIPFGLRSVVSSQWSGVTVVAGKNGWKTESIQQEMDAAAKQINLIRIKDVSELLRRDLLISASVILVPSLSEGFGLVALEAIQAGVPVVASDRGALPEIVGDTALSLVPDAWQLAVKWLLTDSVFKDDWIKRQSVAASKFSWEHTANMIWDGIESISTLNSKF